MLLSDILIVLLIVVFIGLAFWAIPTSYFILFTVLAICTIVFLFLVEKLLTLKEKVIYTIKSLHFSNKLVDIKQCVENYISQWSGAFLYSHWVKNKFVNFLLNLIVYGIFWSLILYLMIAVVFHLAVGALFCIATIVIVMILGYVLLFIHNLFS